MYVESRIDTQLFVHVHYVQTRCAFGTGSTRNGLICGGEGFSATSKREKLPKADVRARKTGPDNQEP